MRLDLDRIKIVVALRMARAAVGWSQEDLAQRLGVAKTTVARIETGDGVMSAEQYFQFERMYREQGLSIRLLPGDEVIVSVGEDALVKAKERLADGSLRRSDRKKPISALIEVMSKPDEIS